MMKKNMRDLAQFMFAWEIYLLVYFHEFKSNCARTLANISIKTINTFAYKANLDKPPYEVANLLKNVQTLRKYTNLARGQLKLDLIASKKIHEIPEINSAKIFNFPKITNSLNPKKSSKQKKSIICWKEVIV